MSIGRWVDGVERSWMLRRRGPRGNDGTEMLDVAGARLRVRIQGRGSPTIVLAPDPPNVIEHLRDLVDALSSRHRVVCVEMPAFGFSIAPAGFDFSIAQNARIVGALLERVGAAPYALAFPCVSALVGAAVAVSHPELVSHVVGVQAPGLAGAKRWARRVDPRGLLRRDGFGQAIVLATRRRLARSWFDVALADERRRAAFVAEAHAAYDAGATYPLASALQGLQREAAFASPPQPTLLVWGGRDRTHRGTTRDELQPGARVVTLEGAGHFPDLEDSEGFASAVTAFLGAPMPSAVRT